jgi:hypothetical protein
MSKLILKINAELKKILFLRSWNELRWKSELETHKQLEFSFKRMLFTTYNLINRLNFIMQCIEKKIQNYCMSWTSINSHNILKLRRDKTKIEAYSQTQEFTSRTQIFMTRD